MIRNITAELDLSYFRMMNTQDFRWFEQYHWEHVLQLLKVGLDCKPPINALKYLCDTYMMLHLTKNMDLSSFGLL